MSSRELELLGWVFERRGDLKKASVPNPGTEFSTDEGHDGAYELLSSSDTRGDSVASSGIPSTLADRHSELSAEAPAFVSPSVMRASDPFGYQLSHPSPLRNRFITRSFQPSPTPALTPEQLGFGEKDNESTAAPGPLATIACVAPHLAFLPSSYSTGCTLMGLPIVTHAETLLYSPTASSSSNTDHDNDIPTFTPQPRYYIPYLQLGYLELTDDLIHCICPFDLTGDGCPHDEVYEWNWIDARWETGGGGCGMLRLCEVSFALTRTVVVLRKMAFNIMVLWRFCFYLPLRFLVPSVHNKELIARALTDNIILTRRYNRTLLRLRLHLSSPSSSPTRTSPTARPAITRDAKSRLAPQRWPHQAKTIPPTDSILVDP